MKYSISVILTSLFAFRTANAVPVGQPSLGGVATNLLEPVSLMAGFIDTLALVVGIMCLMACFLRYMQHRVNPLVAPISSVLLLLVMGLALVFLPFIYKLTTSGIPLRL